jgi:hypothetical protein
MAARAALSKHLVLDTGANGAPTEMIARHCGSRTVWDMTRFQARLVRCLLPSTHVIVPIKELRPAGRRRRAEVPGQLVLF